MGILRDERARRFWSLDHECVYSTICAQTPDALPCPYARTLISSRSHACAYVRHRVRVRATHTDTPHTHANILCRRHVLPLAQEVSMVNLTIKLTLGRPIARMGAIVWQCKRLHTPRIHPTSSLGRGRSHTHKHSLCLSPDKRPHIHTLARKHAHTLTLVQKHEHEHTWHSPNRHMPPPAREGSMVDITSRSHASLAHSRRDPVASIRLHAHLAVTQHFLRRHNAPAGAGKACKRLPTLRIHSTVTCSSRCSRKNMQTLTHTPRVPPSLFLCRRHMLPPVRDNVQARAPHCAQGRKGVACKRLPTPRIHSTDTCCRRCGKGRW